MPLQSIILNPAGDMVYLYNEEFFLSGKAKHFIKRLVGRDFGGPAAVFSSLEGGLKGIGGNFVVNRQLTVPIESACVLSGVKTLKWAIVQKRLGKIKKIIAGPTVALPKEAGGIIFNDAIDLFLVPSSWVTDFCDSFRPGFKRKIRVWAAGVKTEVLDIGTPRATCVVYKKNVDSATFGGVLEVLGRRGIIVEVLEYGRYTRAEYLKKLAKARFLVFLSQSESQGIALNEAWMMDVPTLVWNGSFVNLPDYVWPGGSPAPYLTQECGMFFSGIPDLPAKLELFLTKLPAFRPRAYHLQNFTLRLAAQNFMDIINSLNS